MKKEESVKNMYKKVDATSKTRFHVARRLRLHSKCSTYIVVLISLALILISLMQVYSLGNNITSNLVGLIQVFSAVAVLVYSLLIDKHDDSNLSEKMYSCASQLGELKQKIHPHLNDNHNDDKYNQFRDEFHRILKLYETDSNNDFRGDYRRAKLEMPEHYPVSAKLRLLAKLHIYWSYLIDFFSYIAVIGILGWILFQLM